MDDPIDIVNQRFAKGEIDSEEHSRLIELLNKSRDSATNSDLDTFKYASQSTAGATVDTEANQPAEIQTDKGSGLKWSLVGTGVLALLLFGLLNMPSKDRNTGSSAGAPSSNWHVSEEAGGAGRKVVLTLPEENSSGNYAKTAIKVGCSSKGFDLSVFWGAPMKNMFPRSNPDATRVYAKFGSTEQLEMGWALSSDTFVTSTPRLQLNVGSAVDSLIFSMLGMNSTSQKNMEMFNWKSSDFIQRIANHAAKGGAETKLSLFAKNVNNDWVELNFDVAGFNTKVNRNFKGLCIS